MAAATTPTSPRSRSRSPIPKSSAYTALDSVARSFARVASPEPTRLKQLDDRLSQYDLLNDLETTTGIRKSHWLILSAAFIMAFILFGFGSNALCEWIGYLYPLYASFKCLEERQSDLVTAWLIYWIVFGLFQMNEFIADSILSKFPFYFPLKVVFVMWCILPHYRGAGVVFDAWIRHVFVVIRRQVHIVLHSLGRVLDESTSSVGDDLRISLLVAYKKYPSIFSFLLGDHHSADLISGDDVE